MGTGVDDVATRAAALGTVEGWTGPAAVRWEKDVGTHAAALAPGGDALQQAGRVLLTLAEEMEQARAAIHRLADEVREAEAAADRAARHAIEVRRTWMASGGGSGQPPPRVEQADAAAIAAADEGDEVLRRCLQRSRARRDEVRACDRRAAAALERAADAAPLDEPRTDPVGWCGTTTGGRPPRGPRGQEWQPAAVVETAWAEPLDRRPSGPRRPQGQPVTWAEPVDLEWRDA